MKSPVVKRSIVVHGRKTSVSIEDSFWHALRELAKAGGNSLSDLVGTIADSRVERSNLSSAIRVHVLGHFRDKAAALASGGERPGGQPPRAVEIAATPERRPSSAFGPLR
ncbi:ribbon-helix-helix domain-containing protein [Xanthobacteraceae bacterium Astr-EGSB]|uniref:ribbon-helix-helix domain-containing protein n=1 Tax=Astrobacterium formosum TaxID=3069710 RepID=UPI0027AEEEE3|nr:ribbon-helix-helix domain-containing protein [Xanthobacteraceae bacterium Astr-EGSB]